MSLRGGLQGRRGNPLAGPQGREDPHVAAALLLRMTQKTFNALLRMTQKTFNALLGMTQVFNIVPQGDTMVQYQAF